MILHYPAIKIIDKLYSINDLTAQNHGDLDLLVRIQVDILSLTPLLKSKKQRYNCMSS